MKRACSIVLLLSTALAAIAQAGVGAGEIKKVLEGIGQQLGADTKGLAKFSYQQRTEVEVKGESKGATLAQVFFGPDGKPMVTPLSAPQEPQGRQKRGVRGAVQREAKADAKEDIQDLLKLSNGYLILNQERLQDLLQKSEVSFLPSESAVKLSAKDLIQPGDQVFRKFDGKSFRQLNTRVETSADGKPVTITATYQTHPSGLTYCAQSEIAVPAKGLKITINTMNYQPQ